MLDERKGRAPGEGGGPISISVRMHVSKVQAHTIE